MILALFYLFFRTQIKIYSKRQVDTVAASLRQRLTRVAEGRRQKFDY